MLEIGVHELRQRQKGALAQWLQDHGTLYPTRTQKQALARRTDMSYIQVSRWFANRRRKVKSISSISTKDSGDCEIPDDSPFQIRLDDTPESPVPTSPQIGMEPPDEKPQSQLPAEILQLILLQTLSQNFLQMQCAEPRIQPTFDQISPLLPVVCPQITFPQDKIISPIPLLGLQASITPNPAPQPVPVTLGMEAGLLGGLDDKELIAVSVLTDFAKQRNFR